MDLQLGKDRAEDGGAERLEDKNAKFAKGQISEDELNNLRQNPEVPLFKHQVVKKTPEGEIKTNLSVEFLTKAKVAELLPEIKSAWDELSYNDLVKAVEWFVENQADGEHNSNVNVEYYIARDNDTNKPFAVCGLYTMDALGTGFAASTGLDKEKHNLAVGMDWFSVSKEYQGRGVGGYLLNWTEQMAKHRGINQMFIETSDYENEARAVSMYKNRGFTSGFHTPDYFGPGRNLETYYLDTTEAGESKEEPKSPETINDKNLMDVVTLASQTYSRDRFEEFIRVIELLLKKNSKEQGLDLSSLVNRNPKGEIESFAVLADGAYVYENETLLSWYAVNANSDGSMERLVESLKQDLKRKEKQVLVAATEGEDQRLVDNGFKKPTDGVPHVFEQGDESKYLFFTKKLN